MVTGVSLRPRLPQFADRLSLSDQGPSVSPYCLGRVHSAQTVCAAFDAGINFFFVSADLHWPLYEPTRRGLEALLARRPSVRDQIVVAVASYMAQESLCTVPFVELVQSIAGLERIDVLVMGAVYTNDFAGRLRVYQEHRVRRFLGARAIGATFHDRSLAPGALRQSSVDLALLRYSADHAGARAEVFPCVPQARATRLFCFKSACGFVPPRVMEQLGLDAATYWHPEITDHYRFVLSRPEIDGILMAPRTPDELEGVAQAIARGPLTEEEEAYLLDVAMVARGDAQIVSEDEPVAKRDTISCVGTLP